jgi:hypothetical protein
LVHFIFHHISSFFILFFNLVVLPGWEQIEEEMYKGTSSAGKSVIKPVVSTRERQVKEMAEKSHHSGGTQSRPKSAVVASKAEIR